MFSQVVSKCPLCGRCQSKFWGYSRQGAHIRKTLVIQQVVGLRDGSTVNASLLQRSVPIPQVRQPGTLGSDGLFWTLRPPPCTRTSTHTHKYKVFEKQTSKNQESILRCIWIVRDQPKAFEILSQQILKTGSARWFSRQRHLPLNLTTCVQSLDSHGGRKEKVPSCPLTSMCALHTSAQVHTQPHTHTHH